jgi:hypothetical protein
MALVPSLASIADLMDGKCDGAPSDGDVLAFYGKSTVDEFIQEATGSKISHVAVLMRDTPGGPLQVLEATGAGVTLTELGKSVEWYAANDHIGFYLPLSAPLRARVDPQVLTNYYRSNALDKYNYEGVVEAGLYDLGHPFYARVLQHFGRRSLVGRAARWWEELRGQIAKVWQTIFDEEPGYRRLFCSQLVTEVLQAMEVVGNPPEARLVVPVEVTWFDIFRGAYQLNGALLAEPFQGAGGPVTAAKLARR